MTLMIRLSASLLGLLICLKLGFILPRGKYYSNIINDVEARAKFKYKITTSTDTTWIVPVVFHVIYKNEKINLSDSTLYGALETLHDDFLGKNTDLANLPKMFQSTKGKPNIKFVLATKNELPNNLTSITRIKTTENRFDYRHRAVFTLSPVIENTKTLNVYVCDVNTNGYTPTEKNPKNNGVVINYRKVFKGSRTLTHEVGHWLGLAHIFEGGCKGSDKVKDTPTQMKTKFYCPDSLKIQCGHPIMFMNFMDYSTCRIFFTNGQVGRMRAYISLNKKFKFELNEN